VELVNTRSGDERDQETAVFWWLRLPGMAPPDHGPQMPAQVANQVCSLICAIRLRGVLKRMAGSDGFRRCTEAARKYCEWLDDAVDDYDAWLRRVALCEVVDALPENAEIKHVIEYARDLLHKA
jgi:hypothetical protein